MDAAHYPKMEEKILKYWEEHRIFQKSLEKNRNGKKFVFLEGPPTANGLPHPGHVLTRTMKDVILRYKTMQGYYIERKAGWDTHGLPVEIEVEKELGIEDKQEIEEYGIARFNERCRESVFRYEQAWREMTNRVGFWLDMDNPYITLHTTYMESVWWSLKEAWKKGLLYRGHRVTPYCPRCGTTLSSHEVAQGYREVDDPSIFVKFKLKGIDEYFLAWTTTPWTLISNVALAVHPDEWYIKIECEGERLILAEERAASLLKNQEYTELDRMKGKELEGVEYEPLYKFTEPGKKSWFVILADFVTMDEGTGIVHIAPAFGEDDYEAGVQYDLPVIQLVDTDGNFKEEVKPWAGMFVKDADEDIIRDLKERGLLAGTQRYRHQYPFCWRCDSPLLYYAIESWFIGMSKLRENLVKNNDKINWYPEHLKHGRFGDFIREVRDWALSRKRYWGTPLPIWICEKCGREICIGSIEEMRSMAMTMPEHMDLHRPHVDEVMLKCPDCQGTMKRVEEVIDAWYDSGSAFFAQWHYPFENQGKFRENFPADFICEAIDQTRGWFYSLLAISTLIFDEPSYKNVLTLGLILDEQGVKMSKKARNYIEPGEIFSKYGADALRWYLLSASPPWQPKRFYDKAVKEVLSKFLLTIGNIFTFYRTYAVLDAFEYEKEYVPPEKRTISDRWILSKLHSLVKEVEGRMDVFEVHKAARAIEQFVVNDVSNWYVRGSRKRFWKEEQDPDKMAGYCTLYEILATLSRIIAPFVPFMAEHLYLEVEGGESVQLCEYPRCNEQLIDTELEQKMELARRIIEEARAIRAKCGIKLRYPLRKMIVVSAESLDEMASIIREETNVKEVVFSDGSEAFMEHFAKPNYAVLGPKYKDRAKEIAGKIENADPRTLSGMSITIDGHTYTIDDEDFTVETGAKEGYAVGGTDDITIALDTVQTPELLAEGFARELIRRIQEMRKEMNLDMEERIETEINIDVERIRGWEKYLKNETRSNEVRYVEQPEGDHVREWDIDGEKITIGLRRAG
ncbi:MAG TPA: isoleucine--tRNA ligase [Thermoplasmatales archaeon]|nr:isoleucine--tRNA ligase [Thermoplasmatales archaeon]